MKRIAALLPLLLLLAACGAEKPPAPPSAVPFPPAEEIDAAYARAAEAYGWFDMTTMPLAAETVEYEGAVWQRVEYPGITTYDELRAYLETLFSETVVSELLDGDEHYRDIDGALHAQSGGRGADISRGAEERELIENGEGSVTVRVTVEVLDTSGDDPEKWPVADHVVYDFPYERTAAGNWVFTAFSLTR